MHGCKRQRYDGYFKRRRRRLAGTSTALGRCTRQQTIHLISAVARLRGQRILFRLHDTLHHS